MCGIAGIFHLDKKPVAEQILKIMNRTMTHRGPDAEDYHIDRYLGIAHRRLSIIDLNGGKQPLCNEDGSVWIAFNGEIYNFLELKSLLESKGHKFVTKSDTEVIVHLYEQYGEKSVGMLQGMFAYSIWDKTKQKLFIARDRIGIKPLYYYFDGKTFLFGSEIKPILKYGSFIPKNLDYTAIYDYLTFGFIPAPKSIFSNIKKLEPAHTLSIDIISQKITIKKYWDLSFANQIKWQENKLKEAIIGNLKSTVKSHLISDVPLGAFLSGGIDSSAVVAVMSGLINEPIKTCSIGFDNNRVSELPYAKEVAELFKTNHYEHIVTPDGINILDKLLYHYDEPFADTSALPSFYLSKITRQKVTVALSGDGGDENFAGYRRYLFDYAENKIRSLIPGFIRNPLFRTLGFLYPKADWLPQVFRAKTTFQNIAKSPFDAYFNTISIYPEFFLNKILSPDFLKKLDGYSSKDFMKSHYDNADSKNFLDKILYTEIKTFLPDDYLVKVDRASMANSLEVRVPLLDHKFMEFTATIKPNLKLRNFSSKYIFKKSLEPILPDSILYRKKQGFELPVDDWIKKDLKDIFYDKIFSKNSFISNIIQKEYLEKIWNGHQSGTKLYGNNLWLIFLLEAWHDKYCRD
ncbi:asparagine synthase (glutamine-hydrolyzing) [bacterium]|nr:asparagine synthase (glutamine-hydrolyzing) [bacterium]